MASGRALCKRIHVFSFRGIRSPMYWDELERKMDDEDRGAGTGPTREEVLLYSGHAGVSLNDGMTIYGFNPVKGSMTTRALLGLLKSGLAVDGEIKDDTAIFTAAGQSVLRVHQFQILVPSNRYDEIVDILDQERISSKYTYGFPNSDGECNCVTWIERIGVPLVSGSMNEFDMMMNYSLGILGYHRRRFGVCIP